jgi:hypothetical protein
VARFATGLNVQNNLALLIALEKRPDRRATFDELTRQVADAATDRQIRRAEKLYAFDHIDVFQSGLVVAEGDGVRITENGCALLSALGIATREPPDLDPLATVQSLNLIDDLIGPEAHRKIFQSGHDHRHADRRPKEPAEAETPSDQTASPDAPTPEAHPEENETPLAPGTLDVAPSPPPDFLTPKFGAGGPPREVERSGFLGSLLKRGGSAWRGHLERDTPRETTGRSSAKAERLLFAFLALLVFVSGACVVFALIEVKSARTELVALQRELLPLKERLARLEQGERSKQALDRPSSLRERLTGVDVAAQAPPAPRPPLDLSREEIQVIRDFIKPAPTPGSPLPPLAVGDPVTTPTIPVPSAVSEKVPKLAGARFTIRNGAIVIVRSGSRYADAVLAQN